MLVLLDVGNTSVTCGLYRRGKLQYLGSKDYTSVPQLVKKCAPSGDMGNIHVIVSSVVPKTTLYLKKKFRQNKQLQLSVLGSDIRLPLRHKYRSLKKLGIDRQVNAYGAVRLGLTPALIVDFGTAMTVDCISKGGVFEGGLIIPGPELAFRALVGKAALLQKFRQLPTRAGSLLGRSTEECLRSGILHAYGAMTDGLAARLRAHYKTDYRIVLTGGYARHLSRYVRTRHRMDPAHSIRSLLRIFKDLSEKAGG